MVVTTADIKRDIKEKNVTFLRLMFTDIMGVMKNVEIPATEEQVEKVLSNKVMFDGSSIEGFVRINESDMYLYPDLNTWTIFPWGDENGRVAGLICDIYTTEGEPFAGDPRGNLKKSLRRMEKEGFSSFNLGPEPEFFLFKMDEQGNQTLEVKYKGKSIYDVLDMTVEEALPFFENVPSIRQKIQTLYDVGLSYVKLGQPSTELSGGEAQRIKLAAELSKRGTGKTIYILDEPTTGLHFADVHKLIEILQRLTEAGNSVIVIEHNLDVIKTADYIIDMGPEGGDGGGTVVAQGTPEHVAGVKSSYTGHYLSDILGV